MFVLILRERCAGVEQRLGPGVARRPGDAGLATSRRTPAPAVHEPGYQRWPNRPATHDGTAMRRFAHNNRPDSARQDRPARRQRTGQRPEETTSCSLPSESRMPPRSRRPPLLRASHAAPPAPTLSRPTGPCGSGGAPWRSPGEPTPVEWNPWPIAIGGVSAPAAGVRSAPTRRPGQVPDRTGRAWARASGHVAPAAGTRGHRSWALLHPLPGNAPAARVTRRVKAPSVPLRGAMPATRCSNDDGDPRSGCIPGGNPPAAQAVVQ